MGVQNQIRLRFACVCFMTLVDRIGGGALLERCYVFVLLTIARTSCFCGLLLWWGWGWSVMSKDLSSFICV